MSDVKKVAWAVDAFSDSPDLQTKAGRSVKGLIESLNASVDPVWVMRGEPTGIFIPPAPHSRKQQLKTADENMRGILKTIGTSAFRAPRFLACDLVSTTATVRTLLRFAEKSHCDMVVVATHARKGMPRLFLGSFAEAVVLESALPVLVTNAKSPALGKIKHVVFPTDFSKQSLEAYKQALGWCRQLGADLVIFHHIENPLPISPYPFLAEVMTPEAMLELFDAQAQIGRDWVRLAESQGVKARFHLSRKPGDIARKISKVAEDLGASLIAMASQSGTVSAVLLGSLTRKVLREATRPTLVLHSRETRALKLKPILAFEPVAPRVPVLA